MAAKKSATAKQGKFHFTYIPEDKVSEAILPIVREINKKGELYKGKAIFPRGGNYKGLIIPWQLDDFATYATEITRPLLELFLYECRDYIYNARVLSSPDGIRIALQYISEQRAKDREAADIHSSGELDRTSNEILLELLEDVRRNLPVLKNVNSLPDNTIITLQDGSQITAKEGKELWKNHIKIALDVKRLTNESLKAYYQYQKELLKTKTLIEEDNPTESIQSMLNEILNNPDNTKNIPTNKRRITK